MIDVSGAGKMTLSGFVAWINVLSIFHIKVIFSSITYIYIVNVLFLSLPFCSSFSLSLQVHNKYTADDFNDDLCTVLRRAGCCDEKIVFIMDESNVLDSGFLERMNTLLANGEVRREREGKEEERE